MKSILIIIFTIFTMPIFASVSDTDSVSTTQIIEEIDYPIISQDSLGKKVVIMTIEQLKIIDKKLDLLELLEESNSISGDIDSVTLLIINDKNDIIAKQDMQINKMDSVIINKDNEISNLKEQVIEWQIVEETYLKQLSNKSKEIRLHTDRIKSLKKKTIFGGLGGGLIITTLVTILIIK